MSKGEIDDYVWYDELFKCYRNSVGERVTRRGGMKKNDIPMPPLLPGDIKMPSKGVLNMRRSVNEKQSLYIDWLISMPEKRKPTTRKGWAAEHGVSAYTLKRWESDVTFKREWDRRLNEIGFSPENHAKVMNALLKVARDDETASVTAMKLWTERYDKMKPPEDDKPAEKAPSVSDLSDNDLFTLLEVMKNEYEREATKRTA